MKRKGRSGEWEGGGVTGRCGQRADRDNNQVAGWGCVEFAINVSAEGNKGATARLISGEGPGLQWAIGHRVAAQHQGNRRHLPN